MKDWHIEEEIDLFSFLLKKTIERKKIKNLLKYKKIKVNGKVKTQYNTLLKKGDHIVVDFKTGPIPIEFEILYEDKDIIVVNKKAGLLTISTDKEKEKTLYHFVSLYCKQNYPNQKIFIVHRLDKDTSGIVLFAKNQKTKEILQKNWNQMVQKRGYVAVVEGILSKKEGTIISYLYEGKNKMVYSSWDAKRGKKAITKYRVIEEKNGYSLLDIELETGRKNQIRVHMKMLNHPIVGDKKYGSFQDPFHRMALHADELWLLHPYTKKLIQLNSSIMFSMK